MGVWWVFGGCLVGVWVKERGFEMGSAEERFKCVG